MKRQLIGPVKSLLSMSGLPLKGALTDTMLPVSQDSGILIHGDVIENIDSYNKLKEEVLNTGTELINLDGDYIALPGFVDAHTHICFNGSRAHDYARRNAGMSYLDIARMGGGIWDTVRRTRQASKEQLIDGILNRVEDLIKIGITTVEVKSGYGLSVESELKMIQSIHEANRITPLDLISTCLAAHIVPKDFAGSTTAYLDTILKELLPTIKSEYGCHRIDAFVEEEAYGVGDVEPYLRSAQEMGFDITLHADQFHPMGSALAVELGAVSADHLEASGEREIDLLAHSDVVATVLPGATLGLGCAFAPARKLLDAGACVAIASDWNPGSAPMGDLLTQASIIGSFEKLSSAEVWAGITYRAAHALRLDDRGKLEQGQLADFILFAGSDFREILYHQGRLRPSQVWKRGNRLI